MPVKKPKTHHRVHREHKKRNRKFLKVYAPYIPLLVVIGLGLLFSSNAEVRFLENKQVMSSSTDISRDALLENTNIYRVSSNSGELKANPELNRAAQLKAKDMVENNYWSHTTPEGKEPWYFIEKAGYSYSKASENLAYGFNSSDSTIKGWLNSPTHRDNLLDESIQDVGFGIISAPNYLGNGPATVVVAMYGSPAGGGSTDTPAKRVLADEQASISHIQVFTGGSAPWSSLVLATILGACLMYLVLKHLHGLRRIIIKGEKFVIKHPLIDLTVVLVVVIAIALRSTAGVIY